MTDSYYILKRPIHTHSCVLGELPMIVGAFMEHGLQLAHAVLARPTNESMRTLFGVDVGCLDGL